MPLAILYEVLQVKPRAVATELEVDNIFEA